MIILSGSRREGNDLWERRVGMMLMEGISVKFVPPVSNRGAQNTCKEGLRVLVDWVAVTVKSLSPEELISVMGLDRQDFVELDYGYSGYRRSLCCGNIRIFFDGREDMGIHLQMSGQGCREYEGKEGFRGWQVFFLCLLDLGGKFTRLDLAIDDFRGYFTLDMIYQKASMGQVASRFKNAVRYEKLDLLDGSKKGYTLYFGHETSRIRIRFYDKYLECLAKGEILEGIDFWNRTELELRKERACKAAEMLAFTEDGGKVVMGVLKQYLRFLVPGKDSNKSRWKTEPFWERFLGDVEGVRLAEDPQERTIEKVVSWIDRQVAPSLLMVAEAESVEFLVELIQRAVERLKPEHVSMIERYRAQKENRVSLMMDDDLYEKMEEEMWERRQKVRWKLLGIEKDLMTGSIRSKSCMS